MRNAAEQAAYEFGRAAAKYEMLVESANIGHTAMAIAGNVIAESNGSRKRPGRVAKASAAGPLDPGPHAAKPISRGVKAAPKPRTKGVKDAIVSLISGSNGMTTGDIIDATGFKPASVNSTLMGLKKDGKATKEDKLWIMTPPTSQPYDSSNSEAGIGSEY